MAYLFVIVSVALGVFTLWRAQMALQLALNMARLDPALTNNQRFELRHQLTAVDQFLTLLLGLVAVLLLLYVEHRYRNSVPHGDLIQRFVAISAVECGALCLVEVTLFGLQVRYQLATLASGYPQALLLVATGCLVWLALRHPRWPILRWA